MKIIMLFFVHQDKLLFVIKIVYENTLRFVSLLTSANYWFPETAMGLEINAQLGKSKYVEAVDE